MIAVQDIYLGSNDIANANQTGAKISPEEFNRVLPDMLYAYYRKLYGLPEHYAPGVPLPPMAYEVTRLITDYVREILEAEKPVTINAKGEGPIPSDYLHHSKLVYHYKKNIGPPEADDNDCHICTDACEDDCAEKTKPLSKSEATTDLYEDVYKDVLVMPESKFRTYGASANRKPTKDYPIAVYRKNIIQFAPIDLKIALLSYLRMPLKPLFTYSIDTDGNVIFSPTGGPGTFPTGNTGPVDVELPLICSYQLCALVAKRFGFYNRDLPLISITESIAKSGM